MFVFYEVYVLSQESRRLVLPRTYCILIQTEPNLVAVGHRCAILSYSLSYSYVLTCPTMFNLFIVSIPFSSSAWQYGPIRDFPPLSVLKNSSTPWIQDQPPYSYRAGHYSKTYLFHERDSTTSYLSDFKQFDSCINFLRIDAWNTY
jgi:hypothetical protein